MNEWEIIEEAMTQPERAGSMTAEDTLLNALEAAGLIHEDWQSIDHENLPKDMREAVTKAVTNIYRNRPDDSDRPRRTAVTIP